jgi:hypothetical protein
MNEEEEEEEDMRQLRRGVALLTATALVVLVGRASSQSPDPRDRVEAATRALEECSRVHCTSAEMQARLDELVAAREAAATARAPVPAPDEPPTPSPEPAGDDTAARDDATSGGPPPLVRERLVEAPIDETPGSVLMQRSKLGAYWAGMSMLLGGGLGLAVSIPVLVDAVEADIEEPNDDVSEASVGSAAITLANLVLAITGICLVVADEPMVPETSVALRGDRLTFHF